MQYINFIKEVQQRGKFNDKEEAAAAIRSVLSVLSESMTAEECEHLKSQLPEELKPFLSHYDYVDKFTLDEFYSRVSEHEQVNFSEAENHSHVVIDVLTEGVSRGEIKHIVDSLPHEFEQLFTHHHG